MRLPLEAESHANRLLHIVEDSTAELHVVNLAMSLYYRPRRVRSLQRWKSMSKNDYLALESIHISDRTVLEF